MRLLGAVHGWIACNPITFALVLFFLGSVASVYSTEIKAFVREKPQNLFVWVLRSRIAAITERIQLLDEFTGNPRASVLYAIALAMMTLMMGISSLFVLSLDTFRNAVMGARDSHLEREATVVFGCVMFLLAFSQALAHSRNLRAAMSPIQYRREFLLKREQLERILRKRLQVVEQVETETGECA